MSNPDWTEAPDDATHYDTVADCFCDVNGWWRMGRYQVLKNQNEWGTSRYTPRPVEPTAIEWDGTGFPPVGMTCEVSDVDLGWIRATVIAHDEDEGVAVCKTDYGYDGYEKLRPIRTQAQIEREELKAANSPCPGCERRLPLHKGIHVGELEMISCTRAAGNAPWNMYRSPAADYRSALG